MATYPRTESRHLPRSYVDKVKETMKELAKDKRLGEFAVSAMKEIKFPPTTQTFLTTPKWAATLRLSPLVKITPGRRLSRERRTKYTT